MLFIDDDDLTESDCLTITVTMLPTSLKQQARDHRLLDRRNTARRLKRRRELSKRRGRKAIR